MKSIKKNRIFITGMAVVMLFGGSFELFANTVDMETAKRVAQNYMNLVRQTSNEISNVVIEQFEGQNSFYAVNFREGGWVLVSAEKSTVPVFAYNPTSAYRIEDEKPGGFLFLLSEYKEQVNIVRRSASTRSVASKKNIEIAEMWNQLMADENNNNTLRSSTRWTYGSYTVGDILLDIPGRGEVAWRQIRNNDGGCNPSFNMFAPSGSNEGCDCDRKPIGCGAVAMGQVMWYWQYPKVFNWNLMPAELNNGQMAEGNEIARLLRLCADATGMVYTCPGSFALPSLMGIALRGSGFKTASVESPDEWGDAWLSLIRTEISCGRPVIYKGEKSLLSSEKHYFVIDGYVYPLLPMFHINFGWNKGSNGFFFLWNIAPGSRNYNSFQTAIIGISPTYASKENITDVSFSTVTNRVYEEAKQGIFLPASGKDLTVESGGSLTLSAGNSVTLGPGFHAKAGSTFNAKIEPMYNTDMEITVSSWPTVAYCDMSFGLNVNNANSSDFKVRNSSGSIVYQSSNIIFSNEAVLWMGFSGGEDSPPAGTYSCTVRLRNNYGRMLEHTWNVTVKDTQENSNQKTAATEKDNVKNPFNSIINDEDFDLPEITESDNFGFIIYPNPNHGNFTIELNKDVSLPYTIEILNFQGMRVYKRQYEYNRKVELKRNNLSQGIYFIKLTMNGKTAVKKIIVR